MKSPDYVDHAEIINGTEPYIQDLGTSIATASNQGQRERARPGGLGRHVDKGIGDRDVQVTDVSDGTDKDISYVAVLAEGLHGVVDGARCRRECQRLGHQLPAEDSTRTLATGRPGYHCLQGNPTEASSRVSPLLGIGTWSLTVPADKSSTSPA